MSKIVKRNGNPEERKKIHGNLAQLSFLKSEYTSWKVKLRNCEEEHEHEKRKLQRANDILFQAQDEFCVVEEEIDSDPLPEGAQPKSRLQRRDTLRMVSDLLAIRPYKIGAEN